MKNAAGFDIPKLMIGSLGRLGVLTEFTFKVFPKAESSRTMRVACVSHEQAIQRLVQAAKSRWELDTIDYKPAEQALYLRLGGPETAVDLLAREVGDTWNGDTRALDDDSATAFWKNISEFEWAPEDSIVLKLPITPKQFLAVQKKFDAIPELAVHLTAGGACAWLAGSKACIVKLEQALQEQELCAMTIRGQGTPLWLGRRPERGIDAAIKQAFDSVGRFPSL